VLEFKGSRSSFDASDSFGTDEDWKADEAKHGD